jgi:ABC-type transport system involved in cytochrome bd biosynthesis fused ATPase/permease subunit
LLGSVVCGYPLPGSHPFANNAKGWGTHLVGRTSKSKSGPPAQYETRIGAGGQSLSSGQRQRVGLARAFARPAPLLILDEALNCLDLDSRKEVISQLKRLRQQRTIVIVSHDPVVLQECDCVMSISDGKLTTFYRQFREVHVDDFLCSVYAVEQVH